MSNNPDYAAHSQSLARPPLSKAALTSLILGVLLCIPFTSLLAILFAIAGMCATRNAAARGRGLAAAGLTLGIIGTLAWIGIGAFVTLILAGSSAPRAALHDFARNVASNNIPAASLECDPSIKATDLDALHAQMAPFGAYSDLTCTNVNLQSTSSGTTCTLAGNAQFSTGTHPFNAVLQKDPSGAWKIIGFHIK